LGRSSLGFHLSSDPSIRHVAISLVNQLFSEEKILVVPIPGFPGSNLFTPTLGQQSPIPPWINYQVRAILCRHWVKVVKLCYSGVKR